jgi:hypothetical protein
MVNKKAMLAVADVIEYNEDRFTLGLWAARRASTLDGRDVQVGAIWTDCGTTACVAGWTCAWADVAKRATGWDDYRIHNAARRELGLDWEASERLFYYDSKSIWAEVADEYGWKVDFRGIEDAEDVKGAQAADVLRRIANGELTLTPTSERTR